MLRKKKAGFTDVYADFAAANTTPTLTYAEAPGVPEYADPEPLNDVTLTRAAKRHVQRKKVDHLAAEAIHLRPAPDLDGRRWKLRVNIDGPRASASPAARLVVRKVDGSVMTRRVRFSRQGRAQALAPFSSTKVVAVTVSFANVSTRFRCGRGTELVCQGTALDNNVPFRIVTKAVKPKRRG